MTHDLPGPSQPAPSGPGDPPLPGFPAPPFSGVPGQPFPGYPAPPFPGFPAPPAPMPPQLFPAPRRLRRAVLLVAATAATLLLMCVGCNLGGALLARHGPSVSTPSPSPSPTVAKGGCVKPDGPATYVPTSCQDAKRTGEVLGLLSGGVASGQSCDPATDQMIVREFDVMCVRHAGTRHVSAAGVGGGVFVPGDCVQLKLELLFQDPTEVPCSRPDYAAKVVARVMTDAECKAPAVYSESLPTDRSPVLCLALGPRVAGPGQCLHIQESEVDLKSVPCTTAKATHKVVARASSEAGCPRGVTSYAVDFSALPHAMYVCLRRR